MKSKLYVCMLRLLHFKSIQKLPKRYLSSEQLVPIGHLRPDQCQAIHPAWHEQEARSFPRQTNPQGDDLHVQNKKKPRSLRTLVNWSLSKRNQRHSYVCFYVACLEPPRLAEGSKHGLTRGMSTPPQYSDKPRIQRPTGIDYDCMFGVPSWFFLNGWMISISMPNWSQILRHPI